MAPKIKSTLTMWLYAMFVMLSSGETRAGDFFAASDIESEKITHLSQGSIWGNRDATWYDASGYAVAPKSRVFWTGGDNALEAATTFAKANHATTLEMTKTGKMLTKLTSYTSPKFTSPLWKAASKRFAKGAKGQVNIFFKSGADGARGGSVFQTKELPHLLKKELDLKYNLVD